MPSAVESVFGRSWNLLRKNWAIVVPGLVIGAVAGAVQFVLAPEHSGIPAGSLPARLIVDVVQILAPILGIAYTTGMATAAWQSGKATFADGKRALDRDALNVFVAMVALFALGLAAAFLAPFTAYVSLFVYLYFCIYTMAAAVVGERSGLEAIAESMQIAYHRPVTTLILVAAIVAIVGIMGLVAELLSATPLVGPLVSTVVVQAVIAYVTLVVVGEYVALRKREAHS
ncbi:MAG: hypothetical protein WAJ85_14180 [Candidatus Baltobacteraceae bacterium]|jgi:hypothetical protein